MVGEWVPDYEGLGGGEEGEGEGGEEEEKHVDDGVEGMVVC